MKLPGQTLGAVNRWESTAEMRKRYKELIQQEKQLLRRRPNPEERSKRLADEERNRWERKLNAQEDRLRRLEKALAS